MLQIYLDIDGVLAKFVSGVFTRMGVEATEDQATKWDFFADLGLSQKDFWETVDAEFWETLDLYPWAHYLVDQCRKLGELRLLTSPGECVKAASAKQAWAKKHFNIPAKHVLVCTEKWRLSRHNAVLIDDYVVNCEEFQQHGDGCSILFAQPWNATASRRRFNAMETVRSLNLLSQIHR